MRNRWVLAPGTLTEVYGLPGVGKTQWLLSWVVQSVLPLEKDGLDASVLIVDTEGNIHPHHLYAQIREALTGRSKEGTDEAHKRSLRVLSKIHIYYLFEADQVLGLLETMLSSQICPKPRILVLDSLAAPLRALGVGIRYRVLERLMAAMRRLMQEEGLTILSSNHLTTVVSSNGVPFLRPALGKPS